MREGRAWKRTKPVVRVKKIAWVTELDQLKVQDFRNVPL